jgi:NAD(P)H-quinone oxidoreductase subunit 5
VIAERATIAGALPANNYVSKTRQVIVGSILAAMLAISLSLFGVNPFTKPGGLVLAGVMFLALTHWIGQVMRTGSQELLIRAMLSASGLCLAYSASYFAVDQLIAASLPVSGGPEMKWVVAAVALAGFAGVFALQIVLSSGRKSVTLNRWRIHASNGFYVESTFRRVFEPLANS